MKKTAILLLFCVFAIKGFSSPDSSSYYAISRLDYYTNEEYGEIMVYVPDSLEGTKITIDIVFEFQHLMKGSPAFSKGISTIPFPTKLLREGQNELTVSFFENDKWTDSRKVWIEIRPHKENAVKIDRATGGLITGDLPIIPFGLSTSFPVDFDKIDNEAAKGFNVISPYHCLDKKSLKGRKAYMNRCAGLGIRVNYNLASLLGEQNKGRSNAEKLEMVRREVETFRDYPALLAWYLYENPDMKDIKPDSLKAAYNLIKELDPYHPVCLLLGSPRNASRYADVMDVVMTAPNPFPTGALLEVKDYVRIVNDAFWQEKPSWVIPQTFGGSGYWRREPTPAEVRAMTYTALMYGARGVQYSNYDPLHSPKSTAMWDECGAIALEIAELTPDFLSIHPAPEIIADPPSIHAKAYNRAGLVTIVLVNDMNVPVQFKLIMKGVDITIEADVMFENRKVQVNNGVIEDLADGFGTRVYRFDARLTPDWMRGLKPGNLVVDPGFEDLSNAGVPTACYVTPGNDPGNTYFIDSRRFFQGEHSLRLNNPSDEKGDKLSFFGLDLSDKKSYTVSVMARTGPSSNLPSVKDLPGVSFRLGLESTVKTFLCTDSWVNYEINGVMDSYEGKVSPWLELAGRGTAWFDNLLVYPDMQMVERRGDQGKVIIEISCIHPDVQIYYTYDGSEPTVASLLYQVPLEMDPTYNIRSAAFKDGVKVGYIER